MKNSTIMANAIEQMFNTSAELILFENGKLVVRKATEEEKLNGIDGDYHIDWRELKSERLSDQYDCMAGNIMVFANSLTDAELAEIFDLLATKRAFIVNCAWEDADDGDMAVTTWFV